MRLIALCLVLTLFHLSSPVSPFCQITKEIGTLPLLSGQTTYVDLLPVFYGYNIQITTDKPDLLTIRDPVSKIAQNNIITPLPNDAVWSVLRPLSDWNQAWQEKAAILYQTSQDSVFVNFGTITPERNYEFASEAIQIPFETKIVCFDAQYVDSEHIVIDCQQANSTTSVLIVLSNTSPKLFRIQGQFTSTRRKLVMYRNPYLQTRLLSLNIKETDDGYSSFVSVLMLSDTYEISQEGTFSTPQLSTYLDDPAKLTDIVTDNRGFIYTGERDNGVFRFIFLEGKVQNISIVALKNYNVGAIAMTRINNQYILDVQLNTVIVRFYDFTQMIKHILSFPTELVPKLLHVNQNALIVEAADMYHIYATNKATKSEVIKVFYKTQLLMAVEPMSDRAFTTVLSISALYSISDGYLLVKSLQESTDITLTFTSYNQTDSVACPTNIHLILVNDSQMIVQLKEVSQEMTAESPVSLSFKLDDYFAGPQLKYNTPDQAGVQYIRKHIEPANIPSPQKQDSSDITNPSLYTTLPIDANNYLRIVAVDKTIFIDQCTLYNREVSVSHVTSYSFDNKVVSVKAGNTYVRDMYEPVIGYQLQGTPNAIGVVDLKNSFKTVFAIGDTYISIDDYQITEKYVAIAVRARSSLFIMPWGSSNVITIDLDFFASKGIEGIDLFKPRAVKTIRGSNFLYIININQIIVLEVAEGQASFISKMDLPEKVDASTEWDIAVTKTNLLVIFADPIAKVYNYKIIGPYEIVLIGTVDLFMQTIPRPLTFQVTNDFVFLQNNRDGVTAIRINQVGLNTNHAYLTVQKPSWFIATNLFDSVTVFELREINGQSSNNSLFFPSPSIEIQTDTHQKEFKKPYHLVINVAGMNSMINLPIELQVFNYQTIIEARQSSEKLWLPASSSDFVYLDINSFIGSVTNYDITCPYCTGDRIRLVQPFDLTTNLRDMDLNDYLDLRGVVWTLANDIIYYSKNDGASFEPVKLNTQSHCLKFIRIDKDHILLFCQGISSQQFVSVTADAEKRPIQTNSFLIDSNFTISTLHSSIYLNNWLFVLDNNNLGTGNGLIRVFRLSTNDDGSVNSTIQETTIDYSTFGLKSNTPIQGFAILPTAQKNIKLIVCTLNDGIGYASFDLTVALNLVDPVFYNLNQDSKVKDYVLEGNKFLQVKYLFSDLNLKNHTILLTVTLGAHLQVTLAFKEGLAITSTSVQNSFNKYGSQTVANTLLATPYSPIQQNLFVIPYINSSSSKVTLGLYRVPEVSTTTTISIKGAVTLNGTTTFTGYLYRNSSSTARFLVSSLNKDSFADPPFYSAYDVSQTLKLALNYNTPGDFDKMSVIASNDFSSATRNVEVDFNSKEGLKWYTVLLLVLGGLTLIGLSFGIFVYRKRRINEEKKISLVTEDEEV